MLRLENSWRLRPSFLVKLTLLLAVAFIIVSVAVRSELAGQVSDRLRGYEADSRRSPLVLDRRLRGDEEARVELANRIQELVDGQARLQEDSFRPPFAVEKLAASVVELVCIDNSLSRKYYTGSGTLIGDEGLVLTNLHLLLSADGTLIRLCGVGLTGDLGQPPRMDLVGQVVATDVNLDLALVKITEHFNGQPDEGPFPSLDVSGAATAARELQLGDAVYIGGYPDVGADTLTMTQGVVAGRVGPNLIKTSAFIDSGASGGAVFDGLGRYVGVPTAAAKGEIGGSLGYLVGGDAVESFLADYQAGKNIVRGP
jgi:S1-C subfamily serine protease